MFLSLGYDITSGLQDLSRYGFKVFDYSSPTEAQLRLAPNRPCMTLVILFLLSVISLHTCVFSSVKACQLNKSDAWKVYAVVGSTFLEFCFGVKSGF